MAETELLFTVAEISVALAGFSAVVVLFKRRDSGKWRAADANRFKKSHIHEDSERNDVGAEQKEISDPDRSDGTADIPGARPALN